MYMYQNRCPILQIDDYGCIIGPPAFLDLVDLGDTVERNVRYDYLDKKHYPESIYYAPICEVCKNANHSVVSSYGRDFRRPGGEHRNEFLFATEKIIPIANGLTKNGIQDKIEVYKTFDWFVNLDLMCKTCGHPRLRMMYCYTDKNYININTEIRIILVLYNAIYKFQHPLA